MLSKKDTRDLNARVNGASSMLFTEGLIAAKVRPVSSVSSVNF